MEKDSWTDQLDRQILRCVCEGVFENNKQSMDPARPDLGEISSWFHF